MDCTLRLIVALAVVAGFVTLTNPVPVYAQTQPSPSQQADALSDSELAVLIEGDEDLLISVRLAVYSRHRLRPSPTANILQTQPCTQVIGQRGGIGNRAPIHAMREQFAGPSA